MKYRTRFSNRVRVSQASGGKSKTLQSQAAACDINNIMSRYRQTGLVDHVNRFQGQYTDLTDVPDYHTSLNKVIAANEAFSQLPAELRRHFSDDPAEFLDFVSDPENASELIEMGLIPSNKQTETEQRPSGETVSGSPETVSADSAEGNPES